MNGLDELKKYLGPSHISFYIGTFLIVFWILASIGVKDFKIMWPLLFFAVLISYDDVLDFIRLNKTIQKYTENGMIDRIVEEFLQAESYADGNLRLGHTHIFGKRSAAVLEYKDIKKVYQYIHRRNFVESRRALHVETMDGKVISLCRLALSGKSDEALKLILIVLLSHNPGIKLGYR